ncbi:MAG TPA: hypothetical protein ENK82_01785 [Campylobacterales bacterium]|nr:hypothetical protein [Campylobacterales bacterium]HHS92053.1 hypothetical protein [Campylobacterales bacterium]
MKPVTTILSHLHTLPQFKLLKQHYCYQKFISLLNPRFQKAIAFVYVRDETLFVALSHPGFKMELNYNKDLLKNLLTLLSEQDRKCSHIKVSKVVLFNSKHLSVLKQPQAQATIPYYQEMAEGNFEILSQDDELIHAFQQIQNSIKNC